MNEDVRLAIKLVKGLIQNSNVKAVNNVTQGDPNIIVYIIDDVEYTFTDLVIYFLDNIENLKRELEKVPIK